MPYTQFSQKYYDLEDAAAPAAHCCVEKHYVQNLQNQMETLDYS